MNFPTFRAISSVGQFGSIEGADVSALSVNEDRSFKARPMRINSLWKVVLTAFLFWSVLAVLPVGGKTEIRPSVIDGIEIDVIHGHPLGNLNTHQGENDVVNVETELPVEESKRNHVVASGSSFAVRGRTSGLSGVIVIVSIPFSLSFEVLSWTLLPCEDSSSRIVGKRFAEELVECYTVNRPEFSLHTFNEFGFRAGGIDVPSGSTFLHNSTSWCKRFLTNGQR